MTSPIDSVETHRSKGATRIAILGTFPPLRGLSSYCLELSFALANLVRIEFISFKRLYPGLLYPGSRLKDDHSFPSLDHRNLRVKRRLTWYNPLTWVCEAISTKADLLHVQWWSWPLAVIYACICTIFKLRGKPVVFTVHNVLSHERSRLYETVSRWLFKLGDHFIVHTEKNRQQMMIHYRISRDRVSLIPHGRLDFHTQNRSDRKKIREEMGIDPNQKVILMFGAIRPYKGIDTAIKAFSEVLRQVPLAVLMIAGKLWQKWEPYQQLINVLGITDSVKTYLDYVPSGDVFQYFEAADLVVLPYHHFDSQSGVGSTAVAFGKPIIVTNVGGLPDLVKGQQCIVPPEDPEALSESIIRCLSDPTQLAAMTADTAQVAAELSWPSIAKMTCAVYNLLLEIEN